MKQCQECQHWYQVTKDNRRKGACQLSLGDYFGPTHEACEDFKRKDKEAGGRDPRVFTPPQP